MSRKRKSAQGICGIYKKFGETNSAKGGEADRLCETVKNIEPSYLQASRKIGKPYESRVSLTVLKGDGAEIPLDYLLTQERSLKGNIPYTVARKTWEQSIGFLQGEEKRNRKQRFLDHCKSKLTRQTAAEITDKVIN